MKKIRLLAGLAALAATPVLAATTAHAWSDEGHASMGAGRYIQANAWHCNTFVDKCSFATSAKAFTSSSLSTAQKMSWVKNVAEVTAHGGSLSISVSNHPGATITGTSSTKSASWTNTNTWISDISGLSDPSWTTTYITTCSTASAYSSALGIKGSAVACALG
jgi:hypothetical protein